jgi:hypothetical protein
LQSIGDAHESPEIVGVRNIDVDTIPGSENLIMKIVIIEDQIQESVIVEVATIRERGIVTVVGTIEIKGPRTMDPATQSVETIRGIQERTVAVIRIEEKCIKVDLQVLKAHSKSEVLWKVPHRLRQC